MRLLDMPAGFENCGNGCGQSVETEKGELLVPVYRNLPGDPCSQALVLRCAFDGETLRLLEIGEPLSLKIPRGLGEPSLIRRGDEYWLALRNDECGLVARSRDGLRFPEMHLWRWDDGSVLQNYNTQQHWLEVRGDLCLVYTRRTPENGHVFRHRAPLFVARVTEDGRLVEYISLEENREAGQSGDQVLGRAERMMPGLGCAFVDIGRRRSGFLPLQEDSRSFRGGPVKSGEKFIVQIRKEETGEKGAFLTRDVTLPGTLVILMPMNR